MPIKPKQIAITPIMHLHAYNIRNMLYTTRISIPIKPKQNDIIPIVSPTRSSHVN